MGDRVGYRSVVQPDGVTDDLGYYDVLNDSRWTPFAGAGGIGWAATALNYDLQFIRTPAAKYLQIEFDPDWPNVAKHAALLHESSRARTMPTDRILTGRFDMTLVGRARSSEGTVKLTSPGHTRAG